MKIDELIQQAGIAADRDADRVSLGLESRVLSRLREESAAESELAELALWARAFYRGALVSVAGIVCLSAIFWYADGITVVEGESAFASFDTDFENWEGGW